MSIENLADKKEALKVVVDLAKQQITLATGAIVFSGVLLKILLGPEQATKVPSGWLFASWGLLILSVIFGLFVSGRYATQLSESKYDIEDNWLTWLGRIQQMLFLLGIIIFGVFAALAWV